MRLKESVNSELLDLGAGSNIRMDLYSFELLDPDPYSEYRVGSGSRG